MKPRRLFFATLTTLLVLSFLASALPIGAQSTTPAPKKPAPKAPAQRRPTATRSGRDEALWQRALQIHRRAIVIDTHNDITTAMTNDDYDLGGTPPAPSRTSIFPMKQGGETAELFSLFINTCDGAPTGPP